MRTVGRKIMLDNFTTAFYLLTALEYLHCTYAKPLTK